MSVKSVLLFLPVVLFAVCCSEESAIKLDEAEAVIYEQPEYALKILGDLDVSNIGTKALRARYSLLYSMALDKNYIDTTDVTVILPAVEYYRKHGSPDEKLKSYYYLGRIHFNRGDINAAAIAYSLCEEQTVYVNDSQAKGLLYMAFSDVYNKAKNLEKEEEYVNKGIQEFKEAGDLKRQDLTYGRLAILYYQKEEWNKADSLFKIGIDKAENDKLFISSLISNYAMMKVLQPEQDPAGALALLDRRVNEYKFPLTIRDYCVYAYASILVGDEKTCNKIEEKLKRVAGPERDQVISWLTKIEQCRGNYSVALDYCYQDYFHNMALAKELISHSVTQTLNDYYVKEAESVKKDARIKTLNILFSTVLIILTMLFLFWVYKRWRDRRELKIERLLRISEESNRILQQNFDEERNELLKQVESFSNKVDDVSYGESKLKETLENLRKAYAATYKEKYTAIGKLCDAYFMAQKRIDKAEIIYRKVENMISFVSDDDKLHRKFENQINRDLNNIVKHLKADLGNLDKADNRFICYCIVGFDSEMIGTILGLSLSNVYTKRFRLRERIRKLDSPYREEYLRML